MSYFRQFPKIGYDLNRNGVLQNVVNIYRSVRPLQNFVDNISAYKYYEIKNGERPDIVSQRIYGTPKYYWTFFIINEYLHDGLAAWPMSQENLFTYIEEEYNGWVVNTRPSIVRNTDQLITDFRDSLSGRFQIGEEVVGSISGARGTLVQKNLDLNQLVIQDTTGSFIGDPDSINLSTELIIGQTTEDSVSTYQAFKYADAPHHYFLTGDDHQRPESNGLFFPGAVPNSQLSYISNRNYLFNLNEERSRMRIIDPNYVDIFQDRFEKVLNSNG